MFGEDGVMRGKSVKKGKGRVKAQLFDSEVREMRKGNAVQRCFSDVPCLRSDSIGEHLSMTGDRSLACNRNFCNINNGLEVPGIIESETAVQR